MPREHHDLLAGQLVTVGDLQFRNEVVEEVEFLFVKVDVFSGQIVQVAFAGQHDVSIHDLLASHNEVRVFGRVCYVSIQIVPSLGVPLI